jgi:hypothetical protein
VVHENCYGVTVSKEAKKEWHCAPCTVCLLLVIFPFLSSLPPSLTLPLSLPPSLTLLSLPLTVSLTVSVSHCPSHCLSHCLSLSLSLSQHRVSCQPPSLCMLHPSSALLIVCSEGQADVSMHLLWPTRRRDAAHRRRPLGSRAMRHVAAR